MVNQVMGLFLGCAFVFIWSSGIVGAVPTLTLENCPNDFVPTSQDFSCTCVAENVDNSTFSILWKDPEGRTVTQGHGNEKTITLLFSAVTFNTKEYRCELLQNGKYAQQLYSPKIAVVPSQPYLKNCPEELLFSYDENASCTCMTSVLGQPPGLLSWEDPKGFTVKLTQLEKVLILPFTAVNDSYSGKDYRCVVTQSVTGFHIGISYKPQVVVTPKKPFVLGLRRRYIVNQAVDIKCAVRGGVPDVSGVDFYCDNHKDQPDKRETNGNLTSSLHFTADLSENNTVCVCKGTNKLTSTEESVIVVKVYKEEAAEGSSVVTIVVPICVALIAAGTAIGVAIFNKQTKCEKATFNPTKT